MTLEYDPGSNPLPGYGRHKPPWWETWVVLGLCLLVIIIGWLWGR